MAASKQRSAWHPANWAPLPAIGVLRLLALLPYPALMAVGRWLGRRLQAFATRRRHIAEINLALCFPERSDDERRRLLTAHFESLGMGLMEVGLTWWYSHQRFEALVEVDGSEHLAPAFAAGHGVIFFTGHFTSLEVSGRVLSRLAPALPMYRPNNNPLLEAIMVHHRERGVERTIPRDDVRLMLRTLRANKGVWFAPDQNYGLKHSVFADFFGVPAACNTSTSRFAGMTGARVVPFVVLRRPQGGYLMRIQPALVDFPGDDVRHDTQRLNDILEGWVREAPEQYNWIHRRFKDRPNGEPRFY